MCGDAQDLEASWPAGHWLVHPALAEFRGELRELRYELVRHGSLAVHASVGGLVFADLGGTDLPVRCQSVRKSLMSALFGVAVHRGLVHLDMTIEQLDVDDIDGLSAQEKTATVRDLLMARSGVYHPSAYRGDAAAPLPPRDSHLPGQRWVYNNWDFNALGTILQHVSGLRTFEALAEWLGGPLQFQDYDPASSQYAFEPVSRHPAYDFRITARDLARIGLLFLRQGDWRGSRLLSEDWVEHSTRAWSPAADGYEALASAYGYLWWIGRRDDLGGRAFYGAIGGHGHALFVLPEHEMVLVHRNYGWATQPTWPEVFPILTRVADLGDRVRTTL